MLPNGNAGPTGAGAGAPISGPADSATGATGITVTGATGITAAEREDSANRADDADGAEVGAVELLAAIVDAEAN
jgi:hypothetical protein